MSSVETRTFRADTLEAALGAVRQEMGPEAIVLTQREGIVGGIGGFFGKHCVEIDVECPPRLASPSAIPAQVLASAYGTSDTPAPVVSDDDPGEIFRNLLEDTSVFASALAEAEAAAVEPEPEPLKVELEPLPETAVISPAIPAPPSVTQALTAAGIDLRLAESVVSDADQQLRAFDPDEPFVNQVRETLAARIPTRRLAGRYRRRVIALVGAPGAGKTSVAARLCEAHAAAGRRVVALSLEPVRKTMELGRRTEGLDVELICADHPGLIDFALARVERAEIVVVDTPGVAANDENGWARLAMLLRPLDAHETHLVLPGTSDTTAVDAQLAGASQKLRIDRFLLTYLDGSEAPGPAVSAAIRAGIPISATAGAARLVPADPYRLAARILP
jgi:flagellar biosynthesis protein FlhF